MKKSPPLDGDGRPKLKPNSFSSLKLKSAHSVSLASFRFLKLDNMSCQMNHILYIALNFEVLKPYSEKKKSSGRKNLGFYGISVREFFTFPSWKYSNWKTVVLGGGDALDYLQVRVIKSTLF